MRLLAHFLTNPLNIFWLLIAAGVVFFYFKKRKPAFGLWIAALVWLGLTASSPVTEYFVKKMERKYPALHPNALPLSDSAVHILVLGGGSTPDPTLPPNDQLSQKAMVRLSEGIRLHRLLPGSTLITSGYSKSGQESIAEIMGRTAESLGVDPKEIRILPEPSRTSEEAAAYVEEFGKNNTLILVTSAIHIPRAMLIFKHLGMEPIPAPTDHIFKINPKDYSFSLLSGHRNLLTVQKLLHEYLGILWEKIQ